MHPQCSSSQNSRVPSHHLLDLPYSTHCGRLPYPLKHEHAKNVSAHFSGASATNCTSEIMKIDVTSVTAAPTHRGSPKVMFSGPEGQNDRKSYGGCHKSVKTEST